MITSEMIFDDFIIARKELKNVGYEIINIRFIDEEYILLAEKK